MKSFTVKIAIILGALMLGTAVASAQDGASLYKMKCQVCHGPDGKANTVAGKKVEAKDFHSAEVAKLSEAEMFEVVKKGKGKMPSYDKKISDDEIRALVKYVRELSKS